MKTIFTIIFLLCGIFLQAQNVDSLMVDSILRGNLVEKAADAGLRSLFVGFETFSPKNLRQSNKKQNLKKGWCSTKIG